MSRKTLTYSLIIVKNYLKNILFLYIRYGGQPSRNDRDNPGTDISVPCPGEEVNGTLNCFGIQVNSVSVELFYT
jgi:hypothetical protein